jgi:hypothetical protein
VKQITSDPAWVRSGVFHWELVYECRWLSVVGQSRFDGRDHSKLAVEAALVTSRCFEDRVPEVLDGAPWSALVDQLGLKLPDGRFSRHIAVQSQGSSLKRAPTPS